MKKAAVFLLACSFAVAAWGQVYPPPPPPGPGPYGPGPRHEVTPEQRQQWREERREKREAWQQLSPEERQQLRRDIRDSGQTLYPRGRHRRQD